MDSIWYLVLLLINATFKVLGSGQFLFEDIELKNMFSFSYFFHK